MQLTSALKVIIAAIAQIQSDIDDLTQIESKYGKK